MRSDYLQLELGCSTALPLREEVYQIKESDASLCHLIFGLSTDVFQLLKKLDGPIYLFETEVGILKSFLESFNKENILNDKKGDDESDFDDESTDDQSMDLEDDFDLDD